MDVAQDYIQILAQRNITIGMDDQLAENTVTPKFQPVILPLVIGQQSQSFRPFDVWRMVSDR